jgi:molybdenum cofactor cytidylyltransferase
MLLIAVMIPAIVLAAGRSSRMGRPKALLPLGRNETFLSRIVRTLQDARVDDVIVVVGHEHEPIVADFARRDVAARFVINHEYESGQLSSIVTALGIVDRPGVVAALITLVDLPLLKPSTVRAVVDHYRHTRAPIVRPVWAGRHGHPVVIDRALFEALRTADPAHGARPVVHAHASAAGDLEIDDPGAFRDVDTPVEYEALLTEVRERDR